MDPGHRFRIVSVGVIALAVMAGVLVSARLTRDQKSANAHPGLPSAARPGLDSVYGPSTPDGKAQYEDGCEPDPKAPPRLQFELAGGVLDLGLVKQGEVLTHTVGVRNVGTGTLCVSMVDTGCGCAKADWPGSRRVEPGALGSVVVKVDTSGKDGADIRPVHVYSNDPEHKVSTFMVKFDVRVGVLVTSGGGGRLYFGQHAVGRPATGTVRLKSPKEGPEWTVTAVKGTRTELGFEVRPVEPADPTFRQLDLVIKHPGSRIPNQYDEDIRVLTSHPDRPEILLHGQLRVVDKFLTSPSGTTSFGFVRPNMPAPTRQVMVLSGEANTEFELEGVEVVGAGFVVVGPARKIREGWAVEVRYDGKSREPGSSVQAQLVIRLKDDEMKELRVALRATVG